MTDLTAITVRKLRAAISDCSPTGYATIRVSTIDRAIVMILSQQAIIDKLQGPPLPIRLLPDTDTGTALQKILDAASTDGPSGHAVRDNEVEAST